MTGLPLIGGLSNPVTLTTLVAANHDATPPVQPRNPPGCPRHGTTPWTNTPMPDPPTVRAGFLSAKDNTSRAGDDATVKPTEGQMGRPFKRQGICDEVFSAFTQDAPHARDETRPTPPKAAQKTLQKWLEIRVGSLVFQLNKC